MRGTIAELKNSKIFASNYAVCGVMFFEIVGIDIRMGVFENDPMWLWMMCDDYEHCVPWVSTELQRWRL